MTTIVFVVPARGRFDLARVCLRQLARTCEALAGHGVRATAVVVADDANIETAHDCGFATVNRENRPLARKLNDGYDLACRIGADYVIPLGSDDWIDPEFIMGPGLPAENQIRCARWSSVVSEDGSRIASLRIDYDGGDGVRIFPTALLEPLRFRPCEEDRERALDTSVFRRLKAAHGRLNLVYADVHPLQIVDFKSHSDQLNGYASCLAHKVGAERTDAWYQLAAVYPTAAIDEMRALHPMAVAA